MPASPGFPRAIAGRYRLDTLIVWEEAQLAAEVVEAAEAITAAAAGTTAEVDATTRDAAPAGKH